MRLTDRKNGQIENIVSSAEKWIAEAKRVKKDDPHLANYILRDLEITQIANLSSLCWFMHNDRFVDENDVDYVIEKLEEYIKEHC